VLIRSIGAITGSDGEFQNPQQSLQVFARIAIIILFGQLNLTYAKMAPRLRLKHAQHKSADNASSIPASSSAAMSSRPRRAAAATANEAAPSSVMVSRSNTPEARRRSIKLTVKLPSSKLREVTTDKQVKALQDTLEPGDYWKTDGQKRRRTQKSYVIPGPSDDDDDDDDEQDEENDDEEEDEGDERDEPMNDFDEIGAEAESSEEEDADGEPDDDEDVDMDEPAHPKPPKIVLKQTPKSGGKISKPTLIVTPAPTGPLKRVEGKEADVDAEGDEAGDDEELSELESDEEEEQEDNGVGGDAEGEEEDMEEEEDADGDDVDIDIDSDGMTPGSGAATPDLAKMTKRQRRDDEGFMALDMAPQVCLTLVFGTTSAHHGLPDQEALHTRGTKHATLRDGKATKEFERKESNGRERVYDQ
jgi:Ino eighty subunit 2